MTQVPRTVPVNVPDQDDKTTMHNIGWIEFEPTVGGWEGKAYTHGHDGEAEWQCTFRGTTYGGVLHSTTRRLTEVYLGVAE